MVCELKYLVLSKYNKCTISDDVRSKAQRGCSTLAWCASCSTMRSRVSTTATAAESAGSGVETSSSTARSATCVCPSSCRTATRSVHTTGCLPNREYTLRLVIKPGKSRRANNLTHCILINPYSVLCNKFAIIRAHVCRK